MSGYARINLREGFVIIDAPGEMSRAESSLSTTVQHFLDVFRAVDDHF